MYLPLFNESEKKYYVKIPAKLCFSAVSIPLLAFITCLAITMYKDFERANNTHCKVPNFFPSISASIGNYEPQQSIWRIAIYIHAPIRFYIIYLRWKYYRNVIQENCKVIVKLAVFLNVMENIALIGLTHWTSSKNYKQHEICFKTFIGTSVFYMLFICILLSKYRRRPSITYRERQSVKLKWRAFLVNVTSFALAAYFFLRHNSYCESYVILGMLPLHNYALLKPEMHTLPHLFGWNLFPFTSKYPTYVLLVLSLDCLLATVIVYTHLNISLPLKIGSLELCMQALSGSECTLNSFTVQMRSDDFLNVTLSSYSTFI